jgi:hypothetical protein
MFLPPALARRFYRNYAEILHPVCPVLDLSGLIESIMADYSGTRPLVDRIERARTMLVLAFGAQLVSSDGDVECPKDVAAVWSETLRRSALVIMHDWQELHGGTVDLIRLWILDAAFSRSQGDMRGQ